VRSEDSALNLIQGEIASLVRVGNRVRVRIGPVTAEVTEASAERLELARGGTAFASFKATGTKLVELATAGADDLAQGTPLEVEAAARAGRREDGGLDEQRPHQRRPDDEVRDDDHR